MSFFSGVGPVAASRLMTVLAVGALTTVGAGAGTAILITGSPSPSAWLAAYQHSRECQRDAAASDPNCSVTANQALAEEQVAKKLEQEAQALKAQEAQAKASPVPASAGSSSAGASSAGPAAAAPALPHPDDSNEGQDG